MLTPSSHWDWKANGLPKEVSLERGRGSSGWRIAFLLLPVTVVLRDPPLSIIDFSRGNTKKAQRGDSR